MILEFGGCATRDAVSKPSPNGIHLLPHNLSSPPTKASSNGAADVTEGLLVCRVPVANIWMRSHCKKQTDRICRYVDVVQVDQHHGRHCLDLTTASYKKNQTSLQTTLKRNLAK